MLVVVFYTDKDGSLVRQKLTGAELRLCICRTEIRIDSHDFSGGFHLRPEKRIHTREAVKRQNRFLDRNMGWSSFIDYAQFFQRSAEHDLCCNFGQRNTGSLTDKRDGSGCPGIHLKNKESVVFDGILNIHQTHNIEFQCHGLCSNDDFIDHRGRNRVRGQNTCGITRMDSRLFNVFHDSTDDGHLPIGNGIHIDFNGIL